MLIFLLEMFKSVLKILDLFVIGLLQKIKLVGNRRTSKVHFLEFFLVETLVVFESFKLASQLV
jgi:hypothetical protein